MIKILEIATSLDGGGVDKLLYDYFTRMSEDVCVDFAITENKEGIFEKQLIENGSAIYRIPQMRGNLKEYCHKLENIMKNGKYDIIHDNTNYASMGSLYVAKKVGIPVRIAHAHTRNFNENLSKKIRRYLMTFATKRLATDLFACGRDAAIWMWGKRKYYSGEIHIVKNAVDLKQFSFSINARDSLREQLGLNDSFVIGNVARFSYEKNHEFLIRIFKCIYEHNKNSVLLLIGRGPLEEKIKNMVSEFGLEKSVIFLGIRDDVYKLLNAMDVFVLPSIYEGLPVTLVEAQVNGLPIITSDVVTDEVKLSNNFKFLSINDSEDVWTSEILKMKNSRNCFDERIVEYDIEAEAKQLELYFRELIRENGNVRTIYRK